jgi:hypothetical protein
MRILDQEAWSRGLFYKVDPIKHTFPALYVRTIQDVAKVLREYPDSHFQVTDLRDLQKLYRLREKRARIAVHECNGDPHPSVTNGDKDACSAAWGKDDDAARAEVEAVAIRCGFIEVSWPGLYPSFKDLGGYEVIEP